MGTVRLFFGFRRIWRTTTRITLLCKLRNSHMLLRFAATLGSISFGFWDKIDQYN